MSGDRWEREALQHYEALLGQMLQAAGIEAAPVYRPGQVQRVLDVSEHTFRDYCNAWEPPQVQGRDPRGLECYFVGGHRRIPHHALIDWLVRNNGYTRNG